MNRNLRTPLSLCIEPSLNEATSSTLHTRPAITRRRAGRPPQGVNAQKDAPTAPQRHRVIHSEPSALAPSASMHRPVFRVNSRQRRCAVERSIPHAGTREDAGQEGQGRRELASRVARKERVLRGPRLDGLASSV